MPLRSRQRVIRPKEGDLRVYNIKNPPNDPVCYPVRDSGHAKRLIEALADSQLLDQTIESNVFGLEVFEDGEWCDWLSEDGEDISAWSPPATDPII